MNKCLLPLRAGPSFWGVSFLLRCTLRSGEFYLYQDIKTLMNLFGMALTKMWILWIIQRAIGTEESVEVAQLSKNTARTSVARRNAAQFLRNCSGARIRPLSNLATMESITFSLGFLIVHIPYLNILYNLSYDIFC